MKDLKNIRYLTGKSNDRKLKRKVPKHLIELAGKQNWVKSVRNLSAAQIKEQANVFGVETDGHIASLESKLNGLSNLTSVQVGSFDLTRERVTQLAYQYYKKSFEGMIEARTFSVSRTDEDFPSILAEAAEDYEHARGEAAGYHVRSDSRAIKLLQEQGLLLESDSTAKNSDL